MRNIIILWKKSILYFLGFVLYGFAFWTHQYFGITSLDELFSTFMFGINGVIYIIPNFIVSIIAYLIICPLILTIIILEFDNFLKNIKMLPTIFLLLACICLGMQYHLLEAIRMLYSDSQAIKKDLFLKHYKDPNTVIFHHSQKRKNLVLIYVESLESTYQNSKLFNRNLLNDFNTINAPKISFNKFIQSKGSEWTIAGIVSSQCGIPFNIISIFRGNQTYLDLNKFLQGATCLGDILFAQGYKNIFLNGSRLILFGDGKFFETHHYTNIIGKEEWLQQGFNYQDMNDWGLPDDLLFAQAKLKLNQLMKQQKLFNLTILTIDTHGVNGQLNKTCYQRGARKFTDIVECTAYEVADFINYIIKQGWLDQINIVVTGDHLAMRNKVSKKLMSIKDRYIFNMIINSNNLQKNRESILHVDLFPTILHSLGITWDDSHLALGYSGINKLHNKFLFDTHLRNIKQISTKRSDSYDKLWLKRP